MRVLRKLLFIAPVLAVLGAFLLGTPVAGAQERQLVDLELSIATRDPQSQITNPLTVRLLNKSDVTVRDIKVQFEVEDIAQGRSIFLHEFNLTGRSNVGTVDYDTLEWTIPSLSAGSLATTRFHTDAARTWPGLHPTEPSVVRLRGTIVASTPRESPRALGNSRARNYFEERKDTPLYTIYNDGTSYGVDADPGTDTFIVRVTNAASSGPWRYGSVRQYELRLKVTPSPGMRYTAAPSDGSTTFRAATGIWDIGTLESGGGNEPAGNKQLNIRVTGRGNLAIPPENQCLTVEDRACGPGPLS